MNQHPKIFLVPVTWQNKKSYVLICKGCPHACTLCKAVNWISLPLVIIQASSNMYSALVHSGGSALTSKDVRVPGCTVNEIKPRGRLQTK